MEKYAIWQQLHPSTVFTLVYLMVFIITTFLESTYTYHNILYLEYDL